MGIFDGDFTAPTSHELTLADLQTAVERLRRGPDCGYCRDTGMVPAETFSHYEARIATAYLRGNVTLGESMLKMRACPRCSVYPPAPA